MNICGPIRLHQPLHPLTAHASAPATLREAEESQSFIRNDWIRKFSHGAKWWDESCPRGTSLKGVDRKKMLRTARISSPLFFSPHLDFKHFYTASGIIIHCVRFNKRRNSLTYGSCLSPLLKKKKKLNPEDIPRPTIWINTVWGPGQIILVTIYGHSVMTGIISALFINKVICEVLLTQGREWIRWQAVMVYGRMVMIFSQQLSAKFRLLWAARRDFGERL